MSPSSTPESTRTPGPCGQRSRWIVPGEGAKPFAGFLLLPDGRVSPSFFHAYPALLAVALALGGIWGALLVNPLLAAAAVLALHALARRVVPSPWALAAPLALALNPALLWQAKFPTSELPVRRAMQLATILEPLLIVAMGLVVMLIVLAVLLPIIQLNQFAR